MISSRWPHRSGHHLHCVNNKKHKVLHKPVFFFLPLYLFFFKRYVAQTRPQVWMCKLAGKSGRTFAATRAHVPTPNTMTSYLHVGNRCIPSGFSIAPLPFSILHTNTNKTLSLKEQHNASTAGQKTFCAHHLRHNDLTQVGIVVNCDTLHSLSAAGGHEDVSVRFRTGGKITDLPDSPLFLPPPCVFCLGFCFVHHGGPYARVWTEAHDEGEGEGQGAGEERKEALEGGDVPLGS